MGVRYRVTGPQDRGDDDGGEKEGAMIDPAFTLDKKAALVVGAANGIGRATALAFAAAGAAVVCADIEDAKPAAAEIEKGGAQALPVHLDVTDSASCRAAVAAAVDRFGGLDVLLYGAADSDSAATVPELDETVWDRVIRINLTGAFLMAKAAIPAMAARGGGSIILIASQLGRVARSRRAAYCATKGALIQLAKVLAADHAAQGIRANTLSPGAVETRRLLRQWKTMEDARKNMGPLHLLGRLGRPEEIARAAVYLASDASSFMTGSDLLIDGGYTAI
jgi:NAD(P)-dependent dehydrogenase (short-subunit alcohol dehydrogenase family)